VAATLTWDPSLIANSAMEMTLTNLEATVEDMSGNRLPLVRGDPDGTTGEVESIGFALEVFQSGNEPRFRMRTGTERSLKHT